MLDGAQACQQLKVELSNRQMWRLFWFTRTDSSSSSIDHQSPATHLYPSVIVQQLSGVGWSLEKTSASVMFVFRMCDLIILI